MEVATDAGAAAPASETVLPTPTEAAPSLDDALSAAYDKITTAPDRSKVTGQFLPKAGTEPEEAPETIAAAEGAETESADPPKDDAAETVETPSIEPPLSWTADMKAKWNALTPEVQTYVAQRDKENHDAISRLGQEKKSFEERAKSFEPLDQLIQSRKDEFARRGVSPAQAFAVLLDAQKRLDENPVTGLVQIAQGYGMSPQTLIDSIIQTYSQQGQAAIPPRDPEIARALAKVQQLETTITEQQRRAQEADKAQREKAEAALASQIAEFSKDKPHFAAVENDVEAMIPVLRAKHPEATPIELLSKAYEAATWANPDVRTRILADQRKADEDKRREEAVKKAKDAAKSAAVNVKSGDATKTNPKNWTDTLSDTAARLYGT